MNLEAYDEWKDTDAVKLAIFFLDAVLQEFISKTEGNYYLANANRFAKRHRALGLGVLGWHSYLQKNGIPFEGLRAKQLTAKIFRELQEKTEKATKDLARIYGEPELLKGYGRRNTTLMAIAPTTSSSAILGQTSPGIEPFSSNYYKAGLSKGNFMRKNKYLKELLASKNMDNEDTWRSIMLNQGSVLHLDGLTVEEKAVFKTFREISQLEIIQQASVRQQYIDQSQSLNLNIPADLSVKEVNKLLIEAWKLGIKTLYYQRSQSVSKELVNSLVTCSSCES
jgi:ribonucleoside-diphosphate reductase alpha chain